MEGKPFFTVIAERRSIRAFADRPVEEDKIQRILETANRAPSAGNQQAYAIYVARDPACRRALAEAAYGQQFVAEAPVVLIFCADPARSAVRYRERGEHLYSLQDATVACTFAMLSTTALGLASVWVGAFNESDVRRAADIPEALIPVAILPIGYAAEDASPTPRRSLDDLVHEV